MGVTLSHDENKWFPDGGRALGLYAESAYSFCLSCPVWYFATLPRQSGSTRTEETPTTSNFFPVLMDVDARWRFTKSEFTEVAALGPCEILTWRCFKQNKREFTQTVMARRQQNNVETASPFCTLTALVTCNATHLKYHLRDLNICTKSLLLGQEALQSFFPHRLRAFRAHSRHTLRHAHAQI